ncbi:UTP--glucose-1-phosphate uridylyltransferase GalU [bacterium]|nr:UTP--glucose-1-phosphate uridylyltransferase GalU [bacterium]
MLIRKAVIPAAGLGTRFLPATKAQPKEMLPIVDKPAIQFVVEEVLTAGISDILIITGRGKRAIEDHFDRAFELEYYLKKQGKGKLLDEVGTIASMGQIHFIRQGTPAGLGHAVLQAKDHVGNEPFVVLLGDDILGGNPACIQEMMRIYEEKKCSVVAVEQVPIEEAHKYGVVVGEKANDNDNLIKVDYLKEKPKKPKSDLAIMGRYVLTPEIFTMLENISPDEKGEIQLTHALEELLKMQPIYAYLFEGLRWDIGNKIGFLKATVDYALSTDEVRDEFTEYLKDKLGN